MKIDQFENFSETSWKRSMKQNLIYKSCHLRGSRYGIELGYVQATQPF